MTPRVFRPSEIAERMANAVPVEEWPIVVDEEVEIFVRHPNAQFARSAEELDQWQGWHRGTWIDFNGGGWTWYGLFGQITHVRPLK